MAWNISEGFEFGIFVRDDVIVEVCCKVGSEFVCPTKVPLFFKLCVTEWLTIFVIFLSFCFRLMSCICSVNWDLCVL